MRLLADFVHLNVKAVHNLKIEGYAGKDSIKLPVNRAYALSRKKNYSVDEVKKLRY